MRPEGNPLDLNNFPEDFTTFRDGKHHSGDDSSSSAGVYRKKKSGAKEGQDQAAGKVYECRFCSLKFCKSQALGGHMNRHRQERETETLNKARHLVFTNDLAPAHLGYASSGQTMYHHAQQGGSNIGGADVAGMPFKSMYPTRMFSTSPIIHPPPPPPPAPPYTYPSPPSHLHSSQYPPVNDYFVGHALSSSTIYGNEASYTCIGAPVGQGLSTSSGSGGGGGLRYSINQDEGLNWGRRS